MANRVVLTPEVRLSYPALIEPKEFIDKGVKSGKFSYQAQAIIPEASLGKFLIPDGASLKEVSLEQLLIELAKEEWPGIVIKEAFAGALSRGWPLKRGDRIADDLLAAAEKAGKEAPKVDHLRGCRVLSVKSNVHPKVSPPQLELAGKPKARILNRNIAADMQAAKNAFQAGNYAVFDLNIKASTVSGLKYLTPYFNSVRWTRDGEKLGNGGGGLMGRFDGINGGSADHDPTQGLVEDEIPF
jgi:hypothetical protein